MKKTFTLQPYFPEIQNKAARPGLRRSLTRRNANGHHQPSQLALRNILGFAAACNFQKTMLHGNVEVVIN